MPGPLARAGFGRPARVTSSPRTGECAAAPRTLRVP
jgi:hypothetical protein